MMVDLGNVEARLLIAFRDAFVKNGYLRRMCDAQKRDGDDGVREILTGLVTEIGNAGAGIAGAMAAIISTEEDDFAKNKKIFVDAIANVMLYVLAVQDKKPDLSEKELALARAAFGVERR